MGGRRLILIPQRPGSIESEGKRVGKPRSRFRSAPKLRESPFYPGDDNPIYRQELSGNTYQRPCRNLTEYFPTRYHTDSRHMCEPRRYRARIPLIPPTGQVCVAVRTRRLATARAPKGG